MKASLQILNKGFIAEYYKQNLFFILIILLFAFGFLSGAEHRQLITIAAQTPTFLGYILLVWVLFFFMNVHFAWQTLSKKEFRIYYHIAEYSPLKAIMLMIYTYFMCSPLSIYYGIFMVITGFGKGFLFMPSTVLAFHMIFTILGGFLYYYRLSLPLEKKQLVLLQISLLKNLKLPFYLFFIRELIHKRPILTVVVKVISFAFILGFIHLYPTDEYDSRLFSMLAVCIGFINYPIIQEYLLFENEKLNFQRTLPIPWYFQYLQMAFVIILLLLPECVFFLIKSHTYVSWTYLSSWIFFVWTVFISIKGIFYLPIHEERVQKWLFGIFIILQIVIMYRIPLPILTCFLVSFSAWIVAQFYHNWEPGKDLFLRK